MTAAEVKSMIEAAVMKFVGNAEPVAVAAPAIPAPVKKRGLSDEQKRKMAEGRERARAAKAGTKPAKPVAAVPKPAKADRPAWEVKPHTTKKKVEGVVVSVGPLSAWLPKGDTAKKQALFAAINVIRSDAAHEIAAAVTKFVG